VPALDLIDPRERGTSALDPRERGVGRLRSIRSRERKERVDSARIWSGVEHRVGIWSGVPPGRGAQAQGIEEGGRRRGWCRRSRASSWLGRWGERSEIPQECGRARGAPHSAIAAVVPTGAGTMLLASSF
jgi:hypothetical protein